MNRRRLFAPVVSTIALLAPASAQARPRTRYTRPDGARCWHNSLVQVTFSRAGAEPPYDFGLVGTVYVKKSRRTVAATNAGDDIFFDGDDVCVRIRRD